jgi:hypothetical protein
MTTTTHNENAQEMAENLRQFNDDYAAGNVDIYEQLEGQILDTRYTFNSSGDCIGIDLLVGYGGPTIWEKYFLDQSHAEIVYSWGGDVVRKFAYAPDITAAIFEIFGDKKMTGI